MAGGQRRKPVRTLRIPERKAGPLWSSRGDFWDKCSILRAPEELSQRRRELSRRSKGRSLVNGEGGRPPHRAEIKTRSEALSRDAGAGRWRQWTEHIRGDREVGKTKAKGERKTAAEVFHESTVF